MRQTNTKPYMIILCALLLQISCGDSAGLQNDTSDSGSVTVQEEYQEPLSTVRQENPEPAVAETGSDNFFVTDNRNGANLIGYESVEAFLEESGFADKDPFYEYFDEDSGELQLVVYYDENDGTGGGVCYDPSQELFWPPQGVLFESVDIEQLSDNFLDTEIEHYQEQVQYTEDKKPQHYLAQGRISYMDNEDSISDIVRIDW